MGTFYAVQMTGGSVWEADSLYEAKEKMVGWYTDSISHFPGIESIIRVQDGDDIYLDANLVKNYETDVEQAIGECNA